MATFSLLRGNLIRKAKVLEETEVRLKNQPPDAAAWLKERLSDQEFVLFCGAGISVPSPASAPAFLELRNAVVLALVDLLLARGLIDDGHHAAVETATKALDGRADLTLPPEQLFTRVRDSFGLDIVSRLLHHCLDRGEPNENHIAIRNLLRAEGSRLSGIITPNFDLYIERALDGIALQRTIVDSVEGNGGFPLYKPHGSLDRPDSIAITVDRVAHPLKGLAREAFKELVAGRTVMVIGYSGWDYDLFPLLIHAGRAWETDILWLLYDDTSMNERAAKIQLALGDRCMILNARRQALLPMLAGVDKRSTTPKQEDLRQAFANILRDQSDDTLIAAFITTPTPSGVPDSAGAVERLAAELLRMVEANHVKEDAIILQRLGLAVAYLKDDPSERKRAARLALECATRLGREPAIRAWQATVQDEDEGESDDPEARLRKLERDLRDFPFVPNDEPEPVLCERSIRTDLLISKAGLLMDMDRKAEGEALARHILDTTTFPTSSVSESAWLYSDAADPWRLHCILGGAAADREDVDEAQAQFCEALDLLWRELELWFLNDALRHVAHLVYRRDRKCLKLAMELCVQIARFSQDSYSELHALEWKLDYHVGTQDDVERVEALLKDMQLDAEDRERHVQNLEWLRQRAR